LKNNYATTGASVVRRARGFAASDVGAKIIAGRIEVKLVEGNLHSRAGVSGNFPSPSIGHRLRNKSRTTRYLRRGDWPRAQTDFQLPAARLSNSNGAWFYPRSAIMAPQFLRER